MVIMCITARSKMVGVRRFVSDVSSEINDSTTVIDTTKMMWCFNVKCDRINTVISRLVVYCETQMAIQSNV
jgi:hypothetical protein